MATPAGGGYEAGGGPSLPGGPAGGGTSVGMAQNVAATLCYVPLCCLNVVWSIYVIVAEKNNKFLRFHAFQSLLLVAAATVVCGVTWVLALIVGQVSGILAMLVSLLQFVVGLAFLGAAIFLAIKAYGNETIELPVIGPMAKQWS
jgi:uncharacterized membrane protein